MRFQVDFRPVKLKFPKSVKYLDVMIDGHAMILCALCDEGTTAIALPIVGDVSTLSFRLPVSLWLTVLLGHRCSFDIDVDEIFCSVDDCAVVSTPIGASNYLLINDIRDLISESKEYDVEDVTPLETLARVLQFSQSLVTVKNGIATAELDNLVMFLQMPFSTDYSIYANSLKFLLEAGEEVHKTRDNFVATGSHQATIVPLAAKTLPCDYEFIISQPVLQTFSVDFSQSHTFLRKLRGYTDISFDINGKTLIAEMNGSKCRVNIDVIGIEFGESVVVSFPSQVFINLMLRQSLYAFTVKLTKRFVISEFASGMIICHRIKIK